MGFTLPKGVILECTQPTNPSEIALLSHLSDPLAKQRRATSPTAAIHDFLDDQCLDSIYFVAQECCPVDVSVNFDDWLACCATTSKSKQKHPDVLMQSQCCVPKTANTLNLCNATRSRVFRVRT